MDAPLCIHCAAHSEVAPTTKYVTCARCNTVLEIKRTDTDQFTGALAPAALAGADVTTPEAKPARKFLGAADVALEEELNSIDSEWQAERDRYLLSSEFGGKQIPDKRRGLFAGGVLVALAIALYFMFQTLQPGTSQDIRPFVSGFVLLFGIGLGWVQFSKGVDYDT